MKATRREAIAASTGVITSALFAESVTADGQNNEDTSEGEQTVELLAESSVAHIHACSHAKFDERTPLFAGETKSEAPAVDDTHIIWEVSYDGEQGYVSFDTDTHPHDGSFVFYLADGSAEVTEGTMLEYDSVDDEDCSLLDEYLVVDSTDQITLKLTADRDESDPSIVEYYTTDEGSVNIFEAAADWRADEGAFAPQADVEGSIFDVAAAWRGR